MERGVESRYFKPTGLLRNSEPLHQDIVILTVRMVKRSMPFYMVVKFIVMAALLSETVMSFRIPLMKATGAYSRMVNTQHSVRKSALYSEQGKAGDSSNSVADDQGKKIEEMMKLFVTAIDEGRQEDLVKAGLKVTTVSAKQALDEKLSDPEIIASILGPMASEEERSLKNELANQITLQQELENSGDRNFEVSGLDPSIFAELQAEAKETLEVSDFSHISHYAFVN